MVDLTPLATAVLAAAMKHDATIATAESCTAGCLATLLADAPGGGECFHGGFVVYTKENKTATLGVPSEMIAAHSAVSQPVAEAMAHGVLERSPADLAIAITGVTGPKPDEDGNPVGLVHIAVGYRGGKVLHRKHMLEKADRATVRARAMEAALKLARDCLETGDVMR